MSQEKVDVANIVWKMKICMCGDTARGRCSQTRATAAVLHQKPHIPFWVSSNLKAGTENTVELVKGLLRRVVLEIAVFYITAFSRRGLDEAPDDVNHGD